MATLITTKLALGGAPVLVALLLGIAATAAIGAVVGTLVIFALPADGIPGAGLVAVRFGVDPYPSLTGSRFSLADAGFVSVGHSPRGCGRW
ncbi:hypothetical protein [Saccharopolyspora pogona]|uniref:hypothetical protein n=1 Tax=Saccharopolyspora pogona TaxID=333966 RepID=UPI00168616C8|nr:hypothetical protein [Saccharopolyspora pogona]